MLGARPEHLALEPGGWPMRVELVEMLGAERLVHGRIGEAAITVRIDGTASAPTAGQTVGVAAQPAQLHWFDASSGRRVGA